MNYSELLKYLFDISNLKLQDIADLLHYDKSYISKWMNGKSIPSISVASDINNELSLLFSEVLFFSENKNLVLDLLPPKQDFSTMSMFKKYLFNLLNSRYFEEFHKDNGNPLKYEGDNLVVIGEKNILDFLLSLFNSNIDRKKFVIYSTLPHKFMAKIFNHMNGLWLFSLKFPIELNILLNCTHKNNQLDDSFNYLKILGDISLYDINVFTKKDNQSYSYYLYVKDEFVIIYNEIINDKPVLITFSKNQELLKQLNISNNKLFKLANPILQTNDKFTYENFYYEKNLNKDLTLFTSYIDGCFIKPSDLKDLFNKYSIAPSQFNMLKNTTKLQGYSFKNTQSMIIINLISLFSSIEKNKISIGPYYLQLDKKDYINYLTSVYKILSELDNKKFFLIDSNYISNYNLDYFMSFVLSDNCIILKKLDPFDNKRFKYVVSTDASVISFFKYILTSIHETNYIKESKLTELKNLISSKIISLNLLDN
ncbi:helix-turn-helix domain-containing protein [Peptoniphilus sp. MSJ-1]|uniref:Helix-turn-helix domain-containing protein n=1 Tax=Peptoniphilus ovalis TaxID=2841503 RepID=A0ABS6FHG2_9FIRM|nr:helix-turn-helix transcriptional regulator [Peptoniphilus ovalis]MBU5668670.1 helix-turn-helix domain-containing protein [Peptoniphilus ovalis]